MNNKGTFTISIAKIAWALMTMIFVTMAFAYGQSCQLLPGWSPSTLGDGQSRTGYQIPKATFTQSCTWTAWLITCISGSVANGNVFTYPSCIPHTWTGCSTPTGANHLQYKTLYKLNHNTFTQTCQELSQSLQCLNGVFTWGITPRLYTFATCIDTPRAQCIDTRTTPASYKDHGETVVGYLAAAPGFGQTCSTLQRTLTCTNSFRSGNGNQGQAGLVTGCTNPSAFSGCLNVRTNIMAPHSSSINAYTSPWGICTGLLKTLTCTNGFRLGNGSSQQAGLYSGCTEANQSPCPNIITYSGTLPHGTFITKYSSQYALWSNGHYCTDYAKVLQCKNGLRSGNQLWLFTGCQNVQSGSCRDTHTASRIPPYGFVYRYDYNQPTGGSGCADMRHKVLCINGARSGNINLSPTCGNCELPRWGVLAEGQTTYGYSTILRSLTWVNYVGGCNAYGAQMKCVNSMLQGVAATWIVGAFTPSDYPYSLIDCQSGTPRNCTGWATSLTHGQTVTGYSQTWAELPKTCNQNYSTTLTCMNGVINGNRQTYKYATCSGETLANGIDISIIDSPGLPGYENQSGFLVAQGSSPQISILFKNRWDALLDQTFTEPWFLSCTWTEQSLNVYKSNANISLTVNSGTKVGTNIRLKSIFTQSLWWKTLECRIDPAMITAGDVVASNNIRSGRFEVVKADRFDLALSKSIETIKQNLDAAEGAKGTQWLQNLVFNKIMNVLVPIIIVVGILSAILGFYKLMFSSDENAVKEGTRYVIFGIIGIIVIVSARFIGQNVYDLLVVDEIVWSNIASWLYDKIIYPFIKFAIYLVLGAMFVILVSRVITFIFGSDADAQKKAGTLIGRNVISMLLIIGAKQIVEAIYGKRTDVINENATNLWEIGSGILADKNIPILYQIINYALWIASLVILVIIVIQTIKLLTKPDDPAQVKSIKNSLLYMFIGILVLGAGYLIVNFAIIQ